MVPVVGAEEPYPAAAASHRVALIEAERAGVEVDQAPGIFGGDDDVPHPHVTGHEGTHCGQLDGHVIEHRTVEQLDRVAGRVIEASQAGHPAVSALGLGPGPHNNSGGLDSARDPGEVPLVTDLEADG